MIVIEKTCGGSYRVVEFTPDGFLVLGTYRDHPDAVRNARRWMAEMVQACGEK